MRRTDREVTDRAAIDDVLNRARVFSMAMVDKGMPYVVPLSFGYDGKALYVHGAPDGRKVDALKADSRVCFTAVSDDELVKAETACSYGVKARSVIGTGRVEYINDPAGKRAGLDIIMNHYAKGSFTYPDDMIKRTAVFKVVIESVTMKSIGYAK